MMARARTMRGFRAFTLVELLVVMAIVAALIALVVPAFQGIGRGNRITAAGQSVMSQLALARQRALTLSRAVDVRFQKRPPEAGGPAEYASMQIFRAGDSVPLAGEEKLPPGVRFVEGDDFSTLLAARNTTAVGEPGIAPDVRVIRFRPDGSTTLTVPGAGEDQWFVTVASITDKPAEGLPAKNFATVQINPVNGRARLHRP